MSHCVQIPRQAGARPLLVGVTLHVEQYLCGYGDPALVAHHPVVFGVSVRRIDWGAKAAVLPFKVLFRDPPGTAAEPSNSNPDFASNEEVHQLLQGRNADPVDLCGDAIFD